MATKEYISFNNLSSFLDNIKNMFATKEEINTKSDKNHTHSISNVSGLQSQLDNKAASSHGTHVTYSATAPLMDGTASVGSASTVARSDHRHPIDTSRASKTEFDSLVEVVNEKANVSHTHSDASASASGFMTPAMVAKLNGIATGANKTTIDASLSTSSTNPVQNKVVATALNTATSTIATNTSSITANSNAIGNLQTAIAEIQEITSSEIQTLFQK